MGQGTGRQYVATVVKLLQNGQVLLLCIQHLHPFVNLYHLMVDVPGSECQNCVVKRREIWVYEMRHRISIAEVLIIGQGPC